MLKRNFKTSIFITIFIITLLTIFFITLVLINNTSNYKETSVPPAPVLSGWHTENDKLYYYNPITHIKHSGWLNEDGSTYYLNPFTKEKTTGLLKLSDNKIYYFDTEGKLYKDCIMDNFIINEHGLVEEIILPSSDKNVKETLDPSITQIAEQYGATGVSVAVIENGKVTDTFQYGHAVKPDIAMQEDTKIRIASISKVVLSMIALRMQEQGILDINSSIGDYWGFPIKNPYFPDENVSLFSIFTHTSSISDLNSYNSIEANLKASNIFRKIKPTDPLGCSYCNYAFAVAGATVEKAGNKNLHDLSKETFFTDLNIDASFFSGELEDTSLLAELYYADGGVGRSFSSLSDYKATEAPGKNGSLVVGSLCISAKDMAKLVCILANDGVYENKQYLSEETIQMIEAPYCTTDYHGVTVTQCMPLKHNTNIYNQKELYFHTGSAYGVYALMSYNPETKNGAVVITTGASGVQDEFGIYSICGKISNEIYSCLDSKNELLKNMTVLN